MKTLTPISSVLHEKGRALWHVSPEATVLEAIKIMADKNIGALPVMSRDTLVGIITERDYTRKIALMGKTSRDTRVQDVLTGNVICAKPDDTV